VLYFSGRVGMQQFVGAALLLPGVIVGALLSRYMHLRINGKLMRGFVLVFATVSAVVLLVRS
jgi:uncharacterized membrane protein YfcA